MSAVERSTELVRRLGARPGEHVAVVALGEHELRISPLLRVEVRSCLPARDLEVTMALARGRRLPAGAFGVELGRGAASPFRAAASEAPRAWLRIEGRGARERALALLTPELRAALGRTEHVTTLELHDWGIGAVLDPDAPLDALERQAVALVRVAEAADRARTAVPVARELCAGVGPFRALAERLGLELATCPLGVRGDALARRVSIHHAHVRGTGPFVSITAFFARALGDEPLLLVSRRRRLVRTARLVGALFGVGTGTGTLGFDARFALLQGSRATVRAALGAAARELLAAAAKGLPLVVGRHGVTTNVRIPDLARPPELETRTRRLVDLARAVDGARGP